MGLGLGEREREFESNAIKREGRMGLGFGWVCFGRFHWEKRRKTEKEEKKGCLLRNALWLVLQRQKCRWFKAGGDEWRDERRWDFPISMREERYEIEWKVGYVLLIYLSSIFERLLLFFYIFIQFMNVNSMKFHISKHSLRALGFFYFFRENVQFRR